MTLSSGSGPLVVALPFPLEDVGFGVGEDGVEEQRVWWRGVVGIGVELSAGRPGLGERGGSDGDREWVLDFDPSDNDVPAELIECKLVELDEVERTEDDGELGREPWGEVDVEVLVLGVSTVGSATQGIDFRS